MALRTAAIDLNGGGVGNDDDGWLRGIEVIDGALDLDGDGVITGADTGTFFGMPVVNGLLDLNGGGVDTTDDGYTGGDTLAYEVTDMQGHYLFTSVPAGNYVVLVNEGSLPGAPGSLTETAGTTNASALISHAAGAIDLDVDFGYVPTTKAVIGNFVWSDADGDGVQDPGEPGIGGVTLGLLKDADNNGTFETTVTTTTTAADGSYYFFGVDPGKYKVEVTSALSGYTLTTGPQSSTDPTAAITVGAGTIYDKADFGYTNPNLYSISDRTWYDANRNGIAEVSETGIAGVTMDLVLDQNGDGITDYEVIAGRIDLNGDGKADTGDDGTLDGKPVKDGFLDMDGDGFITAADDGTYNGYPVIDGVLDLNASGGVPANTGRIGDLVWLDRNGDGALNAGEGPLSGRDGVPVRILALRERQRYGHHGDRRQRRLSVRRPCGGQLLRQPVRPAGESHRHHEPDRPDRAGPGPGLYHGRLRLQAHGQHRRHRRPYLERRRRRRHPGCG